MREGLNGILPAIASPCDENDRFLEEDFARHAERLYGAGVNGLYVCGATGDGYSMRPGERKRAVEIAVKVSRLHGGKVIAHVGTSNTRDAAELAEHAADAGADAVSSMPPANRDFAQLVSYYTDLARAARLPLLVYHIPLLSGHVLSVDEMLALLDIDGVVGFKFSDWNLFYMKRVLMRRPDAVVFNGNDEFLLPGLLYGASGGIGMTYNIFPRLILGIYGAVKEGDLRRGMELQNLLVGFADVFWKFGGIRANLDALMRHMGWAPYCWRRPRPHRDEETNRRFLREALPWLERIAKAVGGEGSTPAAPRRMRRCVGYTLAE